MRSSSAYGIDVSVTHTCGHSRAHRVKRSPIAERENQIAWLAGTLCLDCQRAAETTKAAGATAHLPALEGSPKQVAWATTIRAKAQNSTVLAAVSQHETSAHWWIDYGQHCGTTDDQVCNISTGDSPTNRALWEHITALRVHPDVAAALDALSEELEAARELAAEMDELNVARRGREVQAARRAAREARALEVVAQTVAAQRADQATMADRLALIDPSGDLAEQARQAEVWIVQTGAAADADLLEMADRRIGRLAIFAADPSAYMAGLAAQQVWHPDRATAKKAE